MIYNKIMKYNISQYEDDLARVLFEVFGEYNGLPYEDDYVAIKPYRINDFDQDGYEWVNLRWKPSKSKYSYIKNIGNGTLETNNDPDGKYLKKTMNYIDGLNKDFVMIKEIVDDFNRTLDGYLERVELEMAYKYNCEFGDFNKIGKILNVLHYDIGKIQDAFLGRYYKTDDDGISRVFTLGDIDKENNLS